MRLFARVTPVNYSADVEAAKQQARVEAKARAAAKRVGEEQGNASKKSASSGGPPSDVKEESSLQEGSTSTQQASVTSVVGSSVSDDLHSIRTKLVDARHFAGPASA